MITYPVITYVKVMFLFHLKFNFRTELTSVQANVDLNTKNLFLLRVYLY